MSWSTVTRSGGPLGLAAPARDRDLARARHLDQPERAHHALEGLDLVPRPGDLDGHRAARDVDDLRAEDVDHLHDLGARGSVRGDLEQRELAGDRLGRLEVADLDDVDQLVQLLGHLIDRVHRAVEGQRDARQRRVVGRADGERVDVEAAAREQARDAGQYAGLVLDQDREDVLASRPQPDGSLKLLERQDLLGSRFTHGSAHHFPGSGARRDHRVRVLLARHLHVDHDRAGSGERGTQVVDQRLLLGQQHAVGAVGLGQLHPVGPGAHVDVGVAPVPEQLLPLADHAQVAVVHDHALDRDVELARGPELLDVHLERAVAGQQHARDVRARDGGTDRRRQAEAHRPEAAGVDPAPRLGEVEVLRRPHLMLADVGGQDAVPVVGGLVKRLDEELRLDLAVRRVVVAQRVLGAPVVDALPPAGEPGLIGLERPVFGHQLRQDPLRVAHDRDVGRDVLGDLGRIDVDVDELGPRRELRQLAGDPVVEAGADRDDQVGLVHRVVGRARAVHAEHAEPLLVRRREGAEAHQRAGDGQAAVGRQLGQLLRRVGIDHAAADVEHRAARVRHRLGREADLLGVALDRRLVAGQVHVHDRLVVDLGAAEVLRDVDQHRPGTAGAGDVERLVHGARDLRRMLDDEGVLDDRHRDAEGVGLLEAVGAEQLGAHLAGEGHQRHGVHHRVGQRRDDVRRARA